MDSGVEESRVQRQVKPPRSGEASRKPRALSRVRTQAISALTQVLKSAYRENGHAFFSFNLQVPVNRSTTKSLTDW